MNESEFESALNSVFDSATDDHYWVALFCDEDGKFVSTVYSEVVRACAIQWGGKYADKWQGMSLFLREMFVAMGGVDKKDCDTAEDGLRLIHNAMCSPALFRDALGRCSVLPMFAGLLYDAMRMGRDGIRVMQFLDCVDHGTAGYVLQYWQENLAENMFELAVLVTKAAKVSPIVYPMKYTHGGKSDWEDTFGIIPIMESALRQESDLYIGVMSSDLGYLIPDHEHGFGSETGLDPFDITEGEVPDDLFKSWDQESSIWVEDAMLVLKTPLRSTAKTYEGYCQSLMRRHADVPYEEMCQRMHSFYAAVQSIYSWWKNAASVAAAPKDGGYVLGTMNEPDLMRSWLE